MIRRKVTNTAFIYRSLVASVLMLALISTPAMAIYGAPSLTPPTATQPNMGSYGQPVTPGFSDPFSHTNLGIPSSPLDDYLKRTKEQNDKFIKENTFDATALYRAKKQKSSNSQQGIPDDVKKFYVIPNPKVEHGIEAASSGYESIPEAAPTVVADYNYTYDLDGNIIKIANTAVNKPKESYDSVDYTYDGVNRITKVTTRYGSAYTEESFEYSAAGNILKRSFRDKTGSTETRVYHYDNPTHPGKATAVVSDKKGTTSFEIDKNGYVVKKTDSNKTVTTYEWSPWNELLTVTVGNSVWRFDYNASHRRISQTLPSGKVVTTLSPDYTVEFTPKGVEGCEQADGCTTKTSYVFSNGELVASFSATDDKPWQTLYYHPDHLGSTNLITNNKGDLVYFEDYSAYGKPNSITTALPKAQARQYIGKEYDGDLGLSYLEARYYDSDVGQFISGDPAALYSPEQFLTDPQQLNSYSYSRNNPINFSDPTGLTVGQLLWGNVVGTGLGLVNISLESAKLGSNPLYAAQSVYGFGREAYEVGKNPIASTRDTFTGLNIQYNDWLLQPDYEAGKAYGQNITAPAIVAGASEYALRFPGAAPAARLNAADLEAQTWLNKGVQDSKVYLGYKDGKPAYVGITNNPQRRAVEHGEKLDSLKVLNANGLTRNQTRGIEQVIKEANPQFTNKINSIDPARNIYGPATDFGKSWMGANEIKINY